MTNFHLRIFTVTVVDKTEPLIIVFCTGKLPTSMNGEFEDKIVLMFQLYPSKKHVAFVSVLNIS